MLLNYDVPLMLYVALPSLLMGLIFGFVWGRRVPDELKSLADVELRLKRITAIAPNQATSYERLMAHALKGDLIALEACASCPLVERVARQQRAAAQEWIDAVSASYRRA